MKDIVNKANTLLKKIQTSALVILTTIAIFAVLRLMSAIVLPPVIAGILFMVLYPGVTKLNNYLPYGLAVVLMLLALVGTTSILIIVFSSSSINSFTNTLPTYIEKIDRLTDLLNTRLKTENIDISSLSSELNWVNSIRNLTLGISSSLRNILSNLFWIIMFLIFMLIEGHKFFATISKAYPGKSGKTILSIYDSVVLQVGSYLALKFVISAVTGALIAVLLGLLNVDFPIVWGILAFILNFIPSIGSLIHTITVTFFTALQFDDKLYMALIVLVALQSIQFIIGSLLEPKIQGDKLKLSPVMILISLVLWNYIWGLIGMLLAIPLLSTIKIVCMNIKSLEKIAIIIENSGASSKKDPSLKYKFIRIKKQAKETLKD